jgi:hypothetical protein
MAVLVISSGYQQFVSHIQGSQIIFQQNLYKIVLNNN